MKHADLSNINEALLRFSSGEAADAYEFLGSHFTDENTAVFRVWAPNAKAVSLCGDFNGWDRNSHMLNPVGSGVWEITVKGMKVMTITSTASAQRITGRY